MASTDLPIETPSGNQGAALWSRCLTILFLVGLVFIALVLAMTAIWAWPPTMGLSLAGGIRIIYEVDRDSLQQENAEDVSPALFNWNILVRALQRRLNPSGTRDVVVRRYDEWQMEIIIPDVDPPEVARLKRLISTAGSLRFRIVANTTDHETIIDAAKQQAKDLILFRSRYVMGAGKTIGFWSRVERMNEELDSKRAFKVRVTGEVIRDANTGELIDLPDLLLEFPDRETFALENYLKEQGINEIDVLMATDDGYDITGEHLGMVAVGNDEYGNPCVKFNMKGMGIGLMGGLTGDNLPDKQRNFSRRMGIILDGTLKSAPSIRSTISDRGMITGDFTKEDVEFLVGILQSGTLPVALKEVPVSEMPVAPIQAVRRTVSLIVRIGLGLLGLIWLAMPFRYGRIGFGASLASLLQVLLMLTVIEVIGVVVTMSLVVASASMLVVGVAGNALICESIGRRIRHGRYSATSVWMGFLRGAFPVTILLGALLFAGVIAYVLSGFVVRNTAVGVLAGAMAAGVTSCFCLLPLVGMLAMQPRAKSLGSVVK